MPEKKTKLEETQKAFLENAKELFDSVAKKCGEVEGKQIDCSLSENRILIAAQFPSDPNVSRMLSIEVKNFNLEKGNLSGLVVSKLDISLIGSGNPKSVLATGDIVELTKEIVLKSRLIKRMLAKSAPGFPREPFPDGDVENKEQKSKEK